MSFYGQMAATAARLMGPAKYGQTVTFTRAGTATTDPITGSVTYGASTTSTASAVSVPITKSVGLAFDNRLEDKSLAGKQLRYLKVAAASIDFEPLPNDKVTMDSATWLVLGCTPINPAGTALVYGVGLVKL